MNRLRQARVIVHSIAIGDREAGHPVPSGRDGEFLTYGGAPVLSRRSDRRLQDVSKATGGVVVPLGLATVDLGDLYDTRIARAEARQRAATRSLGRAERFPLFVLAALVFGLAGSSPIGGRRGWPRLLVVAVAIAAVGAGKGEESAAAAVASGREAYASGRFPEALAAFERAIAHDPGGAIARYDAAATLYQLGRYAEALVRYREARERAGPGLRTKIDYALGNTSLALGDVAAALRHYDACLASTVRGAPFDAVRRDAAINRQFAVEQGARPSIPPDGGGDQPPPSTRSRSKPGRDGEPSQGRSDRSGIGPSPGGSFPVGRPDRSTRCGRSRGVGAVPSSAGLARGPARGGTEVRARGAAEATPRRGPFGRRRGSQGLVAQVGEKPPVPISGNLVGRPTDRGNDRIRPPRRSPPQVHSVPTDETRRSSQGRARLASTRVRHDSSAAACRSSFARPPPSGQVAHRNRESEGR